MSDITTTGNGAQPPSLLNFIERASRDDSIDLEKLERLLQMQERLVAEDARKAFNQAMSAAQGQMRAIWRDAANSQTNSRYAKLETIDDKIRPIYTEHGFSLTFGTDAPRDPASIRIVCTCAHRDGHEQQYELEAPPDMTGARGQVNKTVLHGMGSTITYLRRYLTMMIFNIVLTNEDDDGVAGGMAENVRRPPPPPKPPTRSGRQLLADLQRDADAALTEEDIDSLRDTDEARAILRQPDDHPARIQLQTMLETARSRLRRPPADALDTVLDGPDIDGDETRVGKLIALIKAAETTDEIRTIMSGIIHRNFLERITRDSPVLAAQVIAARDDCIHQLSAP